MFTMAKDGGCCDNDCRNAKTSLYGGQAIIEGVMMKGPERTVAAVRDPEGNIVHTILREGQDEQKRNVWYKIPFVRGMFVLVDSFSLGYKALMYSANVADPEAKPSNPWVETITLVASLGIAILVFKFLPILVATWILGITPKEANASGADLLNFSLSWSGLEGVIKAVVLVGYMLAVRQWGEVRRVFQYHGAEHKTINAYEAGSDLSVDDIMKYPTFHPRCGTSFIFAVILFSLLFAMTFPLITKGIFGNPLLAMQWKYRLVMHLIFLPVIAAFGYEFIRFTGRLDKNGAVMRTLTWPGRMFQKITALEPSRDMVEVAVESMHYSMGIVKEERN
jgi:uncharacterized protein YqhQ